MRNDNEKKNGHAVLESFACGPNPEHKCDRDGPTVKVFFGEGVSGESASCSVCGMSSFDRDLWDGP